MEMTSLERKILSAVARKEPALEQQLASACVIGRQYTGVGFYTDFEVAEGTPKFVSDAAAYTNCPCATHPFIDGAGFILWFREGRFHCLEGHTFHGDWPEDESQFVVEDC